MPHCKKTKLLSAFGYRDIEDGDIVIDLGVKNTTLKEINVNNNRKYERRFWKGVNNKVDKITMIRVVWIF